MRDNIIKKRMRADEVVTKAPVVNRELQKLQQSNGAEQASEENGNWHANDLSGEYQNDSYTCPSCFKKFDRKAVYTSHVQACSDAKCREKDKSKKRKAKEETKSKQLMEFDENSNASDPSVPGTPPQIASTSNSPPEDVNVNKRKRKQTSKVKKEEVGAKVLAPQEESNSVDWNLDDEEEKKKLDNIKKEIVEDDYKRVVQESAHDSAMNSTCNSSLSSNLNSTINAMDVHEPESRDDDDEDSALVIDEKPEEEVGSQFKCPQCDKVFDTDDKLKFHLTTYHSRQKRFKCKMCEYQGYRKKDTINHLNYVHNIEGDKEMLESHMESVMKAVDEESLAKQSELKKNQLKIKRRLARERLKLNGAKPETVVAPKADEPVAVKAEPEVKIEVKPEIKVEFKEPAAVSKPAEPSTPKPPRIRRKSLHTSILIPPESDSADDIMKIPKMFIKTKIEAPVEEKKRKRDSASRSCKSPLAVPQPGQSLLNISKYGKIVKRSPNGDSKDANAARPVRNRIKPVHKDYLYDLSDLLKKDADAYREQAAQSTTVGYKRELRKRAMSTHTREIPGLSSFDEPSSPDEHSFQKPFLTTPPALHRDDDDVPLVKLKDPRNRRMSVFLPPTRPLYPTVPRSPKYKPTPEPTVSKPNAGAAYKMACREFEASRVTLYEPKFHWSICFEQEQKKTVMPMMRPPVPPARSAAASILQKLTGKVDEPTLDGFANNRVKSKSLEEQSTSSMSAEQLCKSFDMINVTSISENEFDIPESRAINLNPGRNGLMALALEEAGKDLCVLQECDPDSDEDEDEEKPSSSSTVSDVEPKKRIRQKKRGEKRSEPKAKRSRKNADKRKPGTNGQRRLTVMQRLQEMKVRKSREQLFKRLIADRQNDDENPSPVYNLFSES